VCRALTHVYHTRRLALNSAFQLVDAGPDGKLRLVQQTVERLHALRMPMDVVAVVGPFHSGKSFLLNSLMGKSRSVDGFKLGYSVEPTTKGIWCVCCTPSARDISSTAHRTTPRGGLTVLRPPLFHSAAYPADPADTSAAAKLARSKR
jgi:hypothetical protein